METTAPDWIDEAIKTLPPLATVKEVMAVLRTGQRNVYHLVRTGRLHAVRPADAGSSRLLIPRSSVGKHLRSLEAS